MNIWVSTYIEDEHVYRGSSNSTSFGRSPCPPPSRPCTWHTASSMLGNLVYLLTNLFIQDRHVNKQDCVRGLCNMQWAPGEGASKPHWVYQKGFIEEQHEAVFEWSVGKDMGVKEKKNTQLRDRAWGPWSFLQGWATISHEAMPSGRDTATINLLWRVLCKSSSHQLSTLSLASLVRGFSLRRTELC